MSNKENNRLPSIIPEDIANNSAEFIQFLKKYYEFMNQEDMPSYLLNNSVLRRDVNNAIGVYLDSLYKELGYGYILNNDANRDNIIRNLGQIYSSKGSVESIKVLFRILFGEEVTVTFPKELILRPSDGNWLSQYSVMMVLEEGDPFSIVGKFVEVETNFPNTPTQFFEVEVKRVERRTDTIYEVFVSRYFSGFFYFDSKIRYNNVEMTLTPSMSSVINIEDGGSGFRVGESFVVNDYLRQTQFNEEIGIPSTYTRQVPSQSRFRNFDIQSVDVDVRTDGTITEVIEYETDAFGSVRRTNIIRGTKQVVRFEYQDGTEEEFTETVEGIVAPNLQVNWDEIAIAILKIDVGETDDDLMTFLKAEDPDYPGFARADIDKDGSITARDAALLYRRGAGVNMDEDQVTWIDEAIVEPLLGTEFNPVLVDGPGSGAVVRVQSVDGSGAITSVRFQSFGYNYPNNFTTFVAPANQSGTPATITFGNKIVGVTTPNYVDRKGFLSDIIKIQDNDFYQQFSYVVQTGVDFDLFGETIRKSVNPAGMKFFAEQTITDTFNLTVSQDDDTSFYYNRLLYDLTDHFDANVKQFGKLLEDEANPVEQETYALEKSQQDEAIVIEDPDYELGKNRFDSVSSVIEKETYILEKATTDSTDEINDDNLDHSLSKPLEDQNLSGATDSEAYALSKSRTDSFSADTEKETYAFTKASTDEALVEENKDYALIKPVNDTASPTEESDYEMGKVLSEEYGASEDKTYSLSKNALDEYAVSEVSDYALLKPQSDSLTSSDELDTLDFGKGLIDTFGTAVTDVEYIMTKSLADLVTVTDDTTLEDDDIYTIRKVLNDTYRVSDRITSIAVTYPLADQTNNVTDILDESFSKGIVDITNLVSDETIYELGKPTSDSFLAIDEFIYEYDNGGYSDSTQGATENSTRGLSKVLADSSNSVNDLLGNLDIVKSALDTVSSVEASTFIINKPLADIADINEDPTFSIEKLEVDEATIQDVRQPLSFGKAATDSVNGDDEFGALITIKALADVAHMSDITTPEDDDIYNINKIISDQLNGDDSLNLTAYSPYVESGYFEDDFDYAVDIINRTT